MSTYNEVKKAALGLCESDRDKLLEVLTAEHAKRKTAEMAAKATGWKQKAWKVAAWIAALLALILGASLATGCTSAVKQSQTAVDGSVTTTERYFSVSAAEARDFAALYGVPQIPVVSSGK